MIYSRPDGLVSPINADICADRSSDLWMPVAVALPVASCVTVLKEFTAGDICHLIQFIGFENGSQEFYDFFKHLNKLERDFPFHHVK